MIGTCSKCHQLYDFQSEEAAYEPGRLCLRCYQASPCCVQKRYAFTREGATWTVTVPDARHPMGWRKLDGRVELQGRRVNVIMYEPADPGAIGEAFRKWLRMGEWQS